MKSRGLNQQLHITHRWILTLCLTVFITPLIAFSQSQETGKMAFFDAHLNRTLAGLDFLSMPAGHQIRSQIAVQFANLNQLSEDQINKAYENGFHGHMHSDTTRTMFQEGSGNEPLRLMIHRSFMVQDGNNGQYQRERTRYRYTYPTLSTILDYLIKQTYYYDMAPFELEEYNDGTGEYEILERLTQVIEQGFTTLQAETWQSGSGWILGDLWYIHLNERSKPDFIEAYDQSRLSPYLFEAHEITSEFATTVDQIEQNPNSVLLYQNYPNPFNPQTEIIFELNESDWVTLSVFDALGRKVRTLVDQVLSSGRHQATFDANFLPTGLYYYQLQTGEEMITRTMIYLK